MAGDGGFEPLTSNLPDCTIIPTQGDFGHTLGVETKHSAPTYRHALAHALKAVAAAGEALVALAELLEQPQGAQGPPDVQQVPALPAVAATSSNGNREVHRG